MSAYDRAAATALKLLNKYGQNVTVTSIASGSYSNGSVTTTSTTSTAKGLITANDTKNIDGTLIKQGDKKLLLDASASVSVGDTVTVNSVVYSVIMTDEKNYNGTRVLWVSIVRIG